jgi:hypothetical protein
MPVLVYVSTSSFTQQAHALIHNEWLFYILQANALNENTRRVCFYRGVFYTDDFR